MGQDMFIPVIDTTDASTETAAGTEMSAGIETAAGIVETTIATNTESVDTGVNLSPTRSDLQKPLSRTD
jgi:hypothetical protein